MRTIRSGSHGFLCGCWGGLVLAAAAVGCGVRPSVDVRLPDVIPTAVLILDVAVLDVHASADADVIKVAVDRIPLDAPRITREALTAVVERAGGHGPRGVAHIGTPEDARNAGEAGVALWVHTVYKERIPDEQIRVVFQAGVPLERTPIVAPRRLLDRIDFSRAKTH